MLKLVKDLGGKELNNLAVGANAKYTSERSIQEFLNTLSCQIKSDVLAKIKASPSLALMIDENTDITILKQLIVYCRILDGGKLASHFLTVRELSDGTVNTIF